MVAEFIRVILKVSVHFPWPYTFQPHPKTWDAPEQSSSTLSGAVHSGFDILFWRKYNVINFEIRISVIVFHMRLDQMNLSRVNSRSVLNPDRPNSIKIKSCLLPLYFHLSKLFQFQIILYCRFNRPWTDWFPAFRNRRKGSSAF